MPLLKAFPETYRTLRIIGHCSAEKSRELAPFKHRTRQGRRARGVNSWAPRNRIKPFPCSLWRLAQLGLRLHVLDEPAVWLALPPSFSARPSAFPCHACSYSSWKQIATSRARSPVQRIPAAAQLTAKGGYAAGADRGKIRVGDFMFQPIPNSKANACAGAVTARGVQICLPQGLTHLSPSSSRPSLFAGD